MSLPDITDLSTLPAAQQSQVVGLLFEPCETLVEYIRDIIIKPEPSWVAFIEDVRASLHHLLETPSDPRIPKIIAAHPRLGAKKVESASSQAEQASLQAASEAEATALAELNAQYEQTFPGLRYVVFVAGRPRTVIMEDMRKRIARQDLHAEQKAAFEAMCDIALDRHTKLQTNSI